MSSDEVQQVLQTASGTPTPAQNGTTTPVVSQPSALVSLAYFVPSLCAIWFALFLIPTVRTVDEVVRDFGFEWIINIAIPLAAACMAAASLQYGYRKTAKTVVVYSAVGFAIVFALAVAILPFITGDSGDVGFGPLMLVSPFILAVMILPFSLYIARLWKKMFAICSRSVCLVVCTIPFLLLAYAWSTSVVTTKHDSKYLNTTKNNKPSEFVDNQIVIEGVSPDASNVIEETLQDDGFEPTHINKQTGLEIKYSSKSVQVIDVSDTSTKFKTNDGAILVFEKIGKLPPHSITEFPSKDLEVQYRLSYLNKGNGWGNFLPYQIDDQVGYLGLYVKPGSACRHEVFMTEMGTSDWYRFGIEECGANPDSDPATLFAMIASLKAIQ